MTFDMKDFLTENKCTYATGLNEGKSRQDYADILKDAADKMMKRGERSYTKEKDIHYKEMLGMYHEDKNDLYQVAKYIEQGRLDLAAKKAQSMDTAARDEIPDSVYDLL